MSSIAKTNISLSKKDLTRSRIAPVASRNIVFYHKASIGSKVINLLSLTMPSAEMPNMVQATADEISGARLFTNKKNLDLISSAKGQLIQGLDYIVTSSTTIQLIGGLFASGTEAGEIFIGTVSCTPLTDIVAVSSKSVTKSYTLAVGQTTLNLGQEYQVGVNPFDKVGVIKVFVNGVLALRGTDYVEVDAGSGSGTTIQFLVAPSSMASSVVVDFGVMAITDSNSIGTIDALSGSIKKIADDLATLAGTQSSDYYSASPSTIERRVFGDKVLELSNKAADIDSKFPTVQRFLSGSGTYTPPSGVKHIKVSMVGAGGGGGGGAGTGASGTATVFGAITAGGGGGGSLASTAGAGGTVTIGSSIPNILVAVTGSGGSKGDGWGDGNQHCGGSGGASMFGGSGQAVYGTGGVGAPNSGGGGAGGGAVHTAASQTSSGGGSGAGVVMTIKNPSSYSYTIGVGGSAAGASGNNYGGGAGGSGIIIVEEFYI